jgi:hypothetical protein
MRFKKDQFNYSGGYLDYTDDNGTKRFVARFKYAQTTSRGPWVTFMIKNFTVEEYFSGIADGYTPLKVMEARGYVLSHIKKWMKSDGWTDLTHAGYKAWTLWRRERDENREAVKATQWA